MAIRLLDTHTAELIAAGEVVERPSSVIKELCENAIDAGASSVTVEIEQGGITLMRVTDDGDGIDAADVELAFVRHATSKVETEEDLNAIYTLGFRGEALASIASVAKVELLTKSDADENATRYTIEGGAPAGQGEAARPRGTTITVRELFYNTPARMKFLKKDASEAAFVTETVSRLALSHPEVAFRYIRDGKPVFSTPGDGDLRGAAYAVLGASFARNLLATGDVGNNCRVVGLVTPPAGGRASRSMQYFFINGRFVKNRTMMAGLEQAYRGMMMHGRYPGAILFLEIEPELVDVNVHPAKTEVRFAKEQDVFGVVYRAVKSALLEDAETGHQVFSFGPGQGGGKAPDEAGSDNAPLALQQTMLAAQGPAGTAEAAPAGAQGEQTVQPSEGDGFFGRGNAVEEQAGRYSEVRATESGEGRGEVLESAQVYVPYTTSALPHGPANYVPETTGGLFAPANGQPAPLFAESGLDVAFDGAADEAEQADAAPAKSAEEAPKPTGGWSVIEATPPAAVQETLEDACEGTELRYVGELFKTYIVTELDERLCLIDKHAAHERILYEQIATARQGAASQQLLAPVHVNLSAEEKNALLQNGDTLKSAGIEVDDFGGNAVMVRGVPADVEPTDVEGLVVEVAGRLSLNAKDDMNEKTEWVLHSIACRAAVKAGDSSDPVELLLLAEDILTGRVPPFCPHGRPVVLEISKKELEKQFGRLG